ncbi:MAG: hypothetical protein Q7S09_00285 [bacterium]|nr:hypothetical protein [bacterium]
MMRTIGLVLFLIFGLVAFALVSRRREPPPANTPMLFIITFAEIYNSSKGGQLLQLRFSGNERGAVYVADLADITVVSSSRDASNNDPGTGPYVLGEVLYGTIPPRMIRVIIETSDIPEMDRWRKAIAEGDPVILWPLQQK